MLLDEVRDAERIGLGSVFLSERFNVKEAATLCGAAAAVSRGGRHRHRCHQHADAPPAGDGGVGEHDARLTRGRFALGIGRGIAPLLDIMGIPPITMAQMEDAVGIYRRLWKGEAIIGPRRPGRARTRCSRSGAASTRTSR